MRPADGDVVLVYQRAAGRILAKLSKTGACAPTWENIHAAVSGGKLCPPELRLADFRHRASKAGIDPGQIVTPAALGRGPSHAEQDAALQHLRGLVNIGAPAAS